MSGKRKKNPISETLGNRGDLCAWDIPGKMNSDTLQFFLPLSRQSLSELEKKGIIERDTKGMYSSAETLKDLIEYYRTQKDSKEEIDRLKADKLRIQVATLEGQYLPRGEVLTGLAKTHSIFAERMNDMPESLASVIDPEHPEKVIDILRNYANQTLEFFCKNIDAEFGEHTETEEENNESTNTDPETESE